MDVAGIDDDGDATGRKHHLANTEAIVGVCCVAPNIGGPENQYLQVKNRSSWANEFEIWLKQPHKDPSEE